MKRSTSFLSLLLSLLLVSGPFVASAVPITSVFQGTGSGTIGATPFTNANFVITASADTTNVQSFAEGWFLVDDLASISISGVGSADFTVSTVVFVNNTGSVVGFNQGSAIDILDLVCDVDCSTWDMTTSFGPVFDPSPMSVNDFVDIGTTLGLLTMTSATSVTYQATVAPEPSTASLLGFGVVGFTFARRALRRAPAGTPSERRRRGRRR